MKKIILWAFAALLFTAAQARDTEARLLRFPAIHGEQVVFSYAGDLYTVPRTGGTARQLTSDPGYELFARISPDGKWIAYTGQHDGNTEVYIIPSTGGTPKRLTYTATLGRDFVWDRMGPNNIVMGWTPDSKRIVFRSRMRSFNSFKGQLFSIGLEGGLPEQLPLATAGFCSYSPDGKKLAFNKVFREFRTWKYYKGGMADDILIFDFESKEMKKITKNPAQDIIPMWVGNAIYFLSDRDRTMNVFKYDLASGSVSKVSDFDNYDVKFPSTDGESVIFENGGYLYVLDSKTDQYEKIRVVIDNEESHSRVVLKDASKQISDLDLAPDGSRLAITGRGDIWSVPVKEGVTRNLTQSNGAHERNVAWSPDGKFLAYISDQSGEDEIYLRDPMGRGEARQLTKGGDTYKYELEWSPDGKKILWADKMLRLQYVDVESGKVTLVTKASDWEIRNYNWSPDSKWITYTLPKRGGASRVALYDVSKGENYLVSSEWYNSNSANFSRDGKFLLFASARDFRPQYSRTEWNHAYFNMEKVYLIPLSKKTASPFALRSDEVNAQEEKSDENESSVDIEGMEERIIALPVEAGNYGNLEMINGKVYYSMSKVGQDGNRVKVYDLEKKKESTIGKYGGYSLSDNGKKMLLYAGPKKYSVTDLPSGETKAKDFVALNDMDVRVDLKEEWKEVYYESWRQMRDFFYDPGMHGNDWPAVYEKYKVLVDHVNHRADLTYIIGEMIGELNVGHAYAGEGDLPEQTRLKTGLLGAELQKDPSGYYRVARILKGENWRKDLRSPLSEAGVGIREGDYLIAINGQSLKNLENPYIPLLDKAGSVVEISYNSKPSAEGAETTLVKPIADESELYYFNWVNENIRKVNEASNGKVGYIHIPDMGVAGLNEFVKHFYPQLRKEGLIIDVRGNGGGNVSPMIIERLRRELAMIDKPRNAAPSTDPGEMLLGPKVTLLDQWSASDGDLFPYRFKHHGIGPLIGHRSWGGVVGIRGSLPLVDGGYLYKPEFASYDVDGKKWIIEGHGVDPDIEVDNNVYKEFMGEDEQLNRGIEEVMKRMETEMHSIPPPPPYPNKTK